MNGWRGWGHQEEQEDKADPTRLKIAFAIGAALGLLVLGWMRFARADEERVVSSSGFSEAGAGLASSPFSANPGAKTGLSLVSVNDAPPPSSVRLDDARSASPYTAGAPPAQTGAAAVPAPGAAAPAAPAAQAAPVDPKEMAAAGLPTDAAGLRQFGSNNRMMTDAIARLIDHPRILKALFDNKLVVSALMDRDTSRRNCSDGAALQSALSSPGAGQAMNTFSSLVSSVLSRPDTVAALAGSEMGSRLLSCPSVQQLASSPSGLMGIVTSNPQALTMASDPRVAQALATLPQGQTLMSGVQSSWSSASGGSSSGR